MFPMTKSGEGEIKNLDLLTSKLAGKNEIDIPYVKRRATIGRSLIFNPNSFASKILTLLTKTVYMYLKVVLGKVFQQ